MIDILIADDHEFFRRNLRSLVESHPELRVCGEAADGIEAIEKARQLRPKLILMDMSMPRMDGAEAARNILREIPESQVIIVSQNDPVLMRRIAAETGAHAFVSKANIVRDLVPAIFSIVNRDGDSAAIAGGRPSRPAQGDWLYGGGNVATLIWEYDWSQTPLGPLPSWPPSLRTSVNLMLNSQHPMWIGWGPEMTFLYNEAYIQVLSLAKHPWALGRPASEVWAEIWDVCGPLADKVFTRGEPSFADDVRLFMNRGDYLEETYYSFSYSPLYDESGKVAGLFCPSTEITSKVLNARRLRTLSELSAKALGERSTESAAASCARIIANNPHDIPFALIYLIDAEKSMATLQGVSQIQGGIDRLSPLAVELTAEVKDELWPIRALVNGAPAQIVSLDNVPSIPLGSSNQRVTQAIVLPLTSVGIDHPIGVLVAGINPTRKLDTEYRTFYSLLADQVATSVQNARALQYEKERADALAEIDRAKTMFFSNVSHEFRTPLTLMLAPLEDMLADSGSLTPATRERLDIAHRNSLRLLKLVNTLLDYSRIEAGRIQASYEATDLPRLTSDLASVFRSAVERAGIRFIVRCDPMPEQVYIDAEMWEKIVFNLLSNAFKFTFAGEIEISLSKVGESAELTVRDSGTGIPEQDLPHLFERFYRVKGAQGRSFEGSGIGLALVQELAKLHGGSARVQSELNRGSTFTVTIPFGKDHLPADRIGAPRSLTSTALNVEPYLNEAFHWLPQSPPSESILSAPTALQTAQDSPAAARQRILLADDNSDMREYVRRLLANEYDVVAVENGEAALRNAKERPPDLILSDVMMPRLDGFALLQAIREDESLRSVPVILLSARAGEESRIEGVRAGADDYLVKPFSARELLARVRTNLQMQRVRKESQQAVKEGQNRLALALEASQTAMFDWDLSKRRGPWNPQMEALYNFSPADEYITAQEWTNLFHPDDIDRLVKEAGQLCSDVTRDKFRFEFRTSPSNGKVRWMLSRGRFERDSSGRPLRMVGLHSDITERKNAEQELRQTHKQLQTMIDSITDGLLIIDREWRFTYFSATAAKILGVRQEEAIGAVVWDFFPHTKGTKFDEFFHRAVETGATQHFEDYYPEPVNKWFECHCYPNEAGLTVYFHDVTLRHNSEEAVRRYRERAEVVARVAQVGFWFCDLPLNKLVWDDRVKEHFWMPPEAEVTIDSFYARLHPDDREPTRQAIEKCIAENIPYDIEYRTVAPDGSQKCIRATGHATYDTTGKPKRFDGLTFDVTQQKSAREATGLLAAIVSSSDDAIISKNLDGVITSWNQAAERIFGYSPAEAIGQHVTLIIPPDRRDEELDILGRMRRGERIEHFDTIRLRKDGVPLNVSLTISPVRDASGRVIGASKIARDVTQQKRAEQRERQIIADGIAANAKFRAVFEQTSVFAGILNVDGVMIDGNKLFLDGCGYKAEDLLGRPFWLTAWWRNCKESQDKIRAATQLAAKGIPYREILRYCWEDGAERLVDFALFPILDDQGKTLFLHLTGVDITDIKRAEEDYRDLAESLEGEVRLRTLELENRNAEVLRQAELLREFSRRLLQAQDQERRHVARELHDSAGQTLTVLGINLAQLVEKAQRDDPQLAGDVQRIQETVQQLQREIRTTSYLLHPPLLDETGLSSALNWYVQGLAERSDLDITLDISENLGRLPRAMELAIFRLVQESLTNVHRHSGSSNASITIARQEEHILVVVRDEGKGMSAEKLAEIQSGGSGVGIRGMRERLRQFNANLQVESDGAGTGILATIPLISKPEDESGELEPLKQHN